MAPRCRDNWGLDLIDQRTLARNGTYTFQVVGGVDRFGNLRTRHGSGDLVEDHCNQAAQPYELDCGSNVGGCIDVWAPASSPDKLLYSKVP